jgi:peptide/nickel transport system substrate-binding protein
MITNTGNDLRELIGNILKDDLAKIGVKMIFSPIEFNTLIVKIDNEYTYESCLLGVGGGDPDPSSGTHIWLSSGRMHQWFPSQKRPATEWEARIDRLMNLQMTTLDRQKRKEYFDEIQYIISDQAPYIYLVIPQVFVAASEKFQNLIPTILSHRLLWNIEEVWIKE